MGITRTDTADLSTSDLDGRWRLPGQGQTITENEPGFLVTPLELRGVIRRAFAFADTTQPTGSSLESLMADRDRFEDVLVETLDARTGATARYLDLIERLPRSGRDFVLGAGRREIDTADPPGEPPPDRAATPLGARAAMTGTGQ